MRREAVTSTLNCPLQVRERLICDDLKAAVGITSDADLVRAALYHFTRQVWGMARRDVDVDLFRLQGAGKRAAGMLKLKPNWGLDA
jgi:hypothetical protein